MDEIEFIARRLCALDGVHPDAKAMDAKWELWTTKTVKVLSDLYAGPAWTFYVLRAKSVLAAQKVFEEAANKDRADLEALALYETSLHLVGKPEATS